MNREVVSNVLRFFVLFLIQGLLLSNLDLLDGKTQVFLYVMFVIMLPLRLSSIFAMGLAFVMGLAVDMFYDSAGLHASAAVMVAFVRPYFIRMFTPRNDYDVNDRPSISRLGLLWFLKFSGVLILIHSLWLYILESFGLFSFGMTLYKSVTTWLVTLLVTVVITYLFAQKRADR